MILLYKRKDEKKLNEHRRNNRMKERSRVSISSISSNIFYLVLRYVLLCAYMENRVRLQLSNCHSELYFTPCAFLF